MPASYLHSLHIDFAPSLWLGRVGMSACPGAVSVGAMAGPQSSGQLAKDVAHMAQQGIKTVVSLLDSTELQRLGALEISLLLVQYDIAWHQLPVVDYGVPSSAVTLQWRRLLPQLTQVLHTSNILIHCAHGKGRTGTMAATLFKSWGWSSGAAMAYVRQYRPGSIETHKQEAYVEAFTRGMGTSIPATSRPATPL